MNFIIRGAIVSAAAALAMPQPAISKSGMISRDLAGTWQLSPARSKFSSADYSSKSDRRTYSVAGNRLVMHSRAVSSSGRSMNWSYSATLDGKWAPVVGNPSADQIALTLVNDRQFKSETRLKGKPAASSTLSLSADGKELTIHRSIHVAKGAPTDDTLIYTRAK